MKKIKAIVKTVKKYLPDAIIIFGIYKTSYYFLLPPDRLFETDLTNYHIEEKAFSIMLIAIGVDLAIRKYITYKKGKNNI